MLLQSLSFSQFAKKCPLTKRDTKLPTIQNHVLNCDWLSFSALATGNFTDVPLFLFQIELADHATQRFNKLYHLKHIERPDEVFAEIQAEPRPSFLDKNLVIVRIYNRFLYSKELKYYVERICSELGFKFKYISRLDLALDFQKFDRQLELTPHDFFEKVASRQYKMRSSKSIQSPYRDDQNVITRGRQIRQLSFGSRRSPVYIVMYNKSMEMRQKKHKPYIIQSWEKVGFDKEIDTYRLEFSLKLKQDFIDTQTGEVINKSDLSILEPRNLERVYRSYYSKHFRVVENDKARLQNCTPVPLFDLTRDMFIQQDLSDKKEAHIHTKSQIKNIVERLNNMGIEDKEIMFDGLNYYLAELVSVHYLHQWFHRKYPNQILPDYQLSNGFALGQQITLFNN